MENLKPLNSLCLTGDIAENWRRWKQRWELYSKASGSSAKGEDVQCAILLHMICEEALNIYDTFTFAAADKDKIQPLIDKFESYFAPKKNITYQRYLFNTCSQNSRLFYVFLIDLQNKAKSCEFGTLADSLIRDHVVCGIDSKPVRERLLRDNELTLTKAIKMVRACETCKVQVGDLQGNNASADAISQERFYHEKATGFAANQTKATAKKICHYYCGTTHGKLCPAYGQRCSKCKKLNHFARVCQSSTRKIQEVLEDDDGSAGVSIDELFIDYMSIDVVIHQNELLSTINVNGSDITFKVHTGAQCNILPLEIFNRISNRPTLEHSNTKLRTYDGSTINLVGKCELNIMTEHQSGKCEFFIVDVNSTKPLLGLKTCQKLDIININTVETPVNTDPILKEFSKIFTGLGHVEGEYHINLNNN